MKKTYEKPAMSVVMLKDKTYLLVDSLVQSKFIDDDYNGWDINGGQ